MICRFGDWHVRLSEAEEAGDDATPAADSASVATSTVSQEYLGERRLEQSKPRFHKQGHTILFVLCVYDLRVPFLG